MKQKLMGLMIIAGGVLSAFAGIEIEAPLVIIILGGFCLGASILFFTSVYSGTIWGIRIKAAAVAKYITIASVAGLVFGGFAIVTTVKAIAGALAAFELVLIPLYLAAFLIPMAVAPMISKVITEKFVVAASSNALCLGEIELFKEIDTAINGANYFIVGFEGIALFSNTNYCYAVYKYEDYRLGELSTPNEVALVGTYCVQKYHDRYTFKFDKALRFTHSGSIFVR